LIDFLFYKFDYRGYHFTSLLLHIAVAMLLFRLLGIITKNIRISFFASLLFLLCPLWVESVTYISGRADILMAVFILFSFICFIADRHILGCIAFVFALLSKEASLIFPFVLVFYIVLFGKINKRTIFYIVLYFLTELFYLLFRFFFNLPLMVFTGEDISLFQRTLFFLKAVIKYIGLIFFPLNQHMAYSVNIPGSLLEKQVLFALVGVLLLIFCFFRYYQKERVVSFFIGWFFIFLIPQSGIFPINSLFAEHFIYLPAMGIFVVFIYFLNKIKFKVLANVIIAGYLFIFGFLVIRYNYVWQDSKKFYERIIKLSGNSFMAYNNLGVIYFDQGAYGLSESLFKQCLEINPESVDAKLNLMKIYNSRNDLKRAIGLGEGIIRKNPNNFLAHNYLGSIFFKTGDYQLAESYFKKAVELNSGYLLLWLDLYSFYKATGNITKADEIREYLAEADRYSLAELYFNDAKSLAGDDRLKEALSEINKAINIGNNTDYYNFKGTILRKIGDFVGAYYNFKESVRLFPWNFEAYNNLGNLFAIAGDFKSAEMNFKQAIKLKESFADAYFNLGLLYFENGKISEAIPYFKKSIIINPDHDLAKKYLDKVLNVTK
jgi:tetratricopeptide (TPR) repeat protein